jgi:hypothetical protein
LARHGLLKTPKHKKFSGNSNGTLFTNLIELYKNARVAGRPKKLAQPNNVQGNLIKSTRLGVSAETV